MSTPAFATDYPSLRPTVATTPLVEYNLGNEATQVSRMTHGMDATIEYGDWGITSRDGTADYDFTVSDSGMLFLDCCRKVRGDIMRERIEDRTKEREYTRIKAEAYNELQIEIHEAGLWCVSVQMMGGVPVAEAWDMTRYHYDNGPRRQGPYELPVALRLAFHLDEPLQLGYPYEPPVALRLAKA